MPGYEGEADVTAQLRPRNELAITTEGGWEEAYLEVRAAAYLRGVTLEGGRVSGRVVGEAPGALDLYLLAGRRTASFTSIQPAPVEGAPFTLEVGDAEGPLRLELVYGAVPWWSEPIA
jgi:hypothetical protein